MKNNKWFLLQLFAGEGADDGGADGAATGDNSAVAGQQRLRELGVPEDRIRKRANKFAERRAGRAAAAAPQAQVQQTSQEQAAAAENPTEGKPEEQSKRLSWDEIMQDPEYNRQMQAVVQGRLKTARAAEENLAKLQPTMDLLAKKYKVDPTNIEALQKAIEGDDSNLEEEAMKRGLPTDALRQIRSVEQERDSLLRQEQVRQQTLQEQKMQQRFQQIQQQSQELKKVFPNFDFDTEMKNPTFARMMAPDMPFSVEDAYHAIHRNEIQAAQSQVIARQTAQMISNSVQAGTMRPAENGTSGQAPSVTTFDYKNATPQERAALKKHILSEAAKGRKVYPGAFTGK